MPIECLKHVVQFMPDRASLSCFACMRRGADLKFLWGYKLVLVNFCASVCSFKCSEVG